MGDAVFEIFVRERLVCIANRPVNELHREAIKHVKASAQKDAAEKLLPLLTEKETAVFKRGRNAKSNTTPKNAKEGDYHYATGLEALFGYLYLSDETDRMKELFNIIWEI